MLDVRLSQIDKIANEKKRTDRLFKKPVQQGRSKRRGEAYFLPYVEPLSAARTPLEGFFNSVQQSLCSRALQTHREYASVSRLSTS
jgi:hypothetical protein